MKVIQVTYENFKNVKDGEYDLNGKSVLLLGENRIGKSNFMNGLQLVLGAKPGKHLIKDGEDRALIEAMLAEYENDQVIDDTIYTFKAVIKKDGKDEKVALQVTMPDGTKDKTKSMVGSIAGEISLENDFVKQSATAEGRRKQLDLVKSFFDKETIEALNAQKNRLTSTYEQRTEVGKESRRLQTLIEATGLKFSDFETYKKEVDVAELTKKITEASTHNTSISDVKLRITQRDESIDKAAKDIESLKEQLEVKQLELAELMDRNVKAQEWLKSQKETDVNSVQEELKKANEYNTMVKKVSDAVKWKKDHETSVNEYGNLTVIYDTGIEAIKDAIKDLQHPIPGLSFDMEDNVFYNGKLVSEDTLSFAECKMLNIELLKAKNSNAKVIFVANGESVGIHYMRDLQKFADENDYQLIVEEVKRGQEELLVEMMGKY